uniref:Aminotransferase verI n=1 Tax=Clonostachys rogersoniana TaxID=122658 RepID=VERI_CLORO|nr:RecName: Full=Aminotransferase verI; AltName: Full=Verticillin biosynthesis cluster protein I [Clonostachys rogersoniana]AQZ42161.1 putative aminotransferase [Gliocladium sp.]
MLSRRARESNAWFLERFKRPLGRQGSKSNTNIDLATAENWLIRPEILSALKRNLQADFQSSHLSYAPGLGGTPELLSAISTFFNHFFSPTIPVAPEHIVTGAGCSSVLDTLINDICDDGDGLLVAAPYWGSFEVSSVLRNGVTLIPVQIKFHESHSAQGIVDAYRKAMENTSCKVRGLLFCNPHNPWGHILSVEVIDALLLFCEQADIHFVSDEIYALSTFGRMELPSGNLEHGEKFLSPATSFVSVLSRDLIKLGGCLITQANKELRMSQAILNNAKLCNAASAMVAPILGSTSQLSTLVNLNVQRMRKAARTAIQFAQFHGLTFCEPVAGVYIWLRLSEDCHTRDDEEEIVQRCTKHGALVGSGSDYSESQPGWFRLTFAIPDNEFLEGLNRIETAMGYKERFNGEMVQSSLGGFVSQLWKRFVLV